MAPHDTVSLFLPAESAAAGDTKRHHPHPHHPPPPAPTQEQLDEALSKEEIRRDAIRQTLLEQARKDYPALMNGVQTGYSADLEGLQQRINNYLAAERNQFHSRTIFLDPAKFDTGIALGLSGPSVIGDILKAQGETPKAETADELADNMHKGFATKFGAYTYTQDPNALTNADNPGLQACVVIPVSDHAVDDKFTIKGLSADDRLRLLNRHESFHCIDDKYRASALEKKDLEKVDGANLASIAASRPACDLIAMTYKKEAFADAGAVGSMIREGYDLSLLDKLSEWRRGRPGDPTHLSTPVLEGLKTEIEKMGLDNFRKLDERQAKDLYYKAVETYGINGRSLQVALKYDAADPLQRIGYQLDAIADKDVNRGIEFRSLVNGKTEVPRPPGLTSAEFEQIGKYDPQAALEQRAFQTSQKVTPVTMIRAYIQLQDELRAQMKAHPESQLYANEMTKLQQAFTTRLKSMDYVEANNRFNVKIENVEPSLAAFAEHPKHPPARTTKPPPGTRGPVS